MGLIHMNGRVYDPRLARFISTDPVIQDPLNGQSLNLYSYVLNNPLAYTDPTGFFSFRKAIGKITGFIKRNILGFAAIAAAIILQQPWALPHLLSTIGIAAADAAATSAIVAGGVSGAIASGGDVQTIFTSAVTAAMFYGVGEIAGAKGWVDADGKYTSFGARLAHTGAHGMVGGFQAVASGGKFHQGFLAAGVAKFAGPMVKDLGMGHAGIAIAHATVGGTASALGGGKFANGAATGAFGYLFNEFAHSDAARGYTSTSYSDGTVCNAGTNAPCIVEGTQSVDGPVEVLFGGVLWGVRAVVRGVLSWAAQQAYGLPPDGVLPPGTTPGTLKIGPASRSGSPGKSLWDERGGEWRYFAGDKHHNAHWDDNPWNSWNSQWRNIDINGKTPRNLP